MEFAKKITRLRFEHDYGEDYVACKLQLSLDTYRQIEKGKLLLTEHLARQVASLYHMSLEEFLEDLPDITFIQEDAENFREKGRSGADEADCDMMTFVKTEITSIKEMLGILLAKVNEMN